MSRLVVLIVEDDTGTANLEAAVLADHDVRLVTTGFEDLLRPDHWADVDVAVIDLMLPGIDGEDIVEYLRASHPQVRRVVCTAKPISDLADVFDKADHVLLKPFGAADLQQAVER